MARVAAATIRLPIAIKGQRWPPGRIAKPRAKPAMANSSAAPKANQASAIAGHLRK
jgi:hypothetical protein